MVDLAVVALVVRAVLELLVKETTAVQAQQLFLSQAAVVVALEQ
jgi:hypothetical protein